MNGPGTRTRLLEAALEVLGESGISRATTREIAERAGVNEVTLFRRFGSKASLVSEAVAEALRPLGAPEPATGDLVADLEQLAARFAALVDRSPDLVARLLLDALEVDPVLPAIRSYASSLRRVLTLHQSAGALSPEPWGDAVADFLAPMVSRATLRRLVQLGPLDVPQHVRSFLEGRLAARPAGPGREVPPPAEPTPTPRRRPGPQRSRRPLPTAKGLGEPPR